MKQDSKAERQQNLITLEELAFDRGKDAVLSRKGKSMYLKDKSVPDSWQMFINLVQFFFF